jgi:hypothetical protein
VELWGWGKYTGILDLGWVGGLPYSKTYDGIVASALALTDAWTVRVEDRAISASERRQRILCDELRHLCAIKILSKAVQTEFFRVSRKTLWSSFI